MVKNNGGDTVNVSNKPLQFLGYFLLLIAAVLLFFGATLLMIDLTLKDESGYYVINKPISHQTKGYGFVLDPDSIKLTSLVPFEINSYTAIKVVASSSSSPDLFLGKASGAKVDSYLEQIPYTKITSLTIYPAKWQLSFSPGKYVPPPPSEQQFWDSTSSASGTTEWDFDPTKKGKLVIMRENGANNLHISILIGIKGLLLYELWIGLLLGGLTVAILGYKLLSSSESSKQEKRSI